MQALFGTDGIRGRVGTGIFVPEQLEQLGRAFGQWIVANHGAGTALLIGSDTRASADWISAALVRGLTQFPLTIYHAGVIPTPAAAVLMRALSHITCSLIISASHNPADDNGIKYIDAHTGKLSAEAESEIAHSFYLQRYADAHGLHHATVQGCYTLLTGAADIYIAALTEAASLQLSTPRRIVLDMAHGATSHLAPRIFTACGAEVIPINNSPTGSNINEHAGATAPEALRRAVLHHQADIGFAFDGDGDRAIAVTAQGVVKDGDDLLCLLSHHQRYRTQGTIVGTVMTNGGLASYLAARHKKLHRTAVGDKYIMQALNEQQLSLGGEPVGHIILRDKLELGDGILVALAILEVVEATENWNLDTFTHLPQLLFKLPVHMKYDLTRAPFAQIIESASRTLHTGRVLVRYSGTEPLLRIMVEAEAYDEAVEQGTALVQELTKAHTEQFPYERTVSPIPRTDF